MSSDNEQFVQARSGRRGVARRGRRRRWVLGGGVLAALALVGTLLTAGSASAASRGFIIRNDSNTAITVAGARAIPRVICIGFKCVPGSNYPIDFSEGRPPDGDVLTPRSTHAWELKYGFDIWRDPVRGRCGVQDQRHGRYRGYLMYVYPTSNDSLCKVIGTTKFTCSAEGRDLTFKNS